MITNGSSSRVKRLEWEGDSLEVIRDFPKEVRLNLGADLRRLQEGRKPQDWRPMHSIGPGVGEIRDQDERAWYRVIFYMKVKDMIYVLHAFEKDTAKTTKHDLRTAKLRQKALQARLRKEGK